MPVPVCSSVIPPRHARGSAGWLLRELTVPIEDLDASHEDDAGLLLEVRQRLVEVARPMRDAAHVGVHADGHDLGALTPLLVERLDLRARPIVETRRALVLDEVERNVVQL